MVYEFSVSFKILMQVHFTAEKKVNHIKAIQNERHVITNSNKFGWGIVSFWLGKVNALILKSEVKISVT